METTYTPRRLTILAASTLTLAALTGCGVSPAADEASTAEPTVAAASASPTSDAPKTWEELTEAQREQMIQQARSKQQALVIYGDHVHWIDSSYPEAQRQWIQEQVALFANTDGPVTWVAGLGADDALMVQRSFVKDGREQTTELYYNTYLKDQELQQGVATPSPTEG